MANKNDRSGCRLVEPKHAQAIRKEIHVMSKMDRIVVTAEDCVRGKMNEYGDSDQEEDEDGEASEDDTEGEEDSDEEET